MEIKDDKLIINTEQVDSVGGAKPEPEERPAVRRMDTDVRVGMNTDGFMGALPQHLEGLKNKTGALPGAVAQQTTVGQFLLDAKPCAGCIHFDKAKMYDMIVKWKSSNDPFDKFELDQLRKANMSEQRIKQMIAQGKDPDSILTDLGVCMAWSRYYLDLNMTQAQSTTITHPLSTCPPTDMAGLPAGPFYTARPDAVIHKIKDDIMFKASGKKA